MVRTADGWQKLFDFLSPFHVVCSWLLPSKSLDHVFQTPPEPNLLQWIVQPTSCNAEVCLVWRHMVNPVMLPRQDNMPVLEKDDPAWKTKICVRPLVNLVRHGYEDDKGKDIALPRTCFVQCFWGKGNKFVCHVCQWDQCHEAVVSVGLYEIMPGNCCWINMMFSKGSDESLSNNGQLHRSPGICSPVK